MHCVICCWTDGGMLLVVVAVLITSISLSLFSDPRFVLVGLFAGLFLAGIFRQLIPLLISARNPEATLLFLLPVVRPFFPLMAFIADPFQKLFDRSRRKDQETENGAEEPGDDDSGDLQALIDVGEAEGILELLDGSELLSGGVMLCTAPPHPDHKSGAIDHIYEASHALNIICR